MRDSRSLIREKMHLCAFYIFLRITDIICNFTIHNK